MIPAVVFVSAFAAMEAVSYATHRWVMHGFGIGWHRSHHALRVGRFERNDLFPIVFSLPAVSLFVASAEGLLPPRAWWAAAGITAYGLSYLTIHELVIHRRFTAPVPNLRCLSVLRVRHAAHHVDGGEPYGMLLPLLSRARRRELQRAEPSLLEGVLARRASTRPTRARL